MKMLISDILAGPKLDRAVAEALGWWLDDETDYGHYPTEYGVSHDAEPIPHYSTNIADAWKLVEREGLFIFWISQKESSNTPAYHGWVAGKWTEYARFFGCEAFDDKEQSLTLDGTCKNGSCAYSETAPLAICRAFLRAKGIDHIEVLDEDTS